MTLDELARETGLTPRTIRFYIGQGIVPPPRNRGRGASYDDDHLAALRRVIELRAQRFRLEEIRSIVGGETSAPDIMVAEGIATPYARDTPRQGDLRVTTHNVTPAGERVREYVGQALARRTAAESPAPRVWIRHAVVDGIEVHVQDGGASDEARIVEDAVRELRRKLTAHRRATGRNT